MAPHRKNLTLFYLFTGSWSLRPTDALWILYLIHLGWSLPLVGLAEAGFHAVALLSDMPAGAFADRYGRRTSLLVGLAVGIVTTGMTFFLAPVSVPLAFLSLSLSALQWTFIGGADRALLWTLSESHPDGSGSYPRLYSLSFAIQLAVAAIGSGMAGWLVSALGWGWPYGVTMAAGATALVVCLFLPGAPPAEHPTTHPWSHLVDGFRLVARRRRLLSMVLFGAALAVVVTLTNLYGQTTIAAKGAPIVLVTLVIAVSQLAAAGASLLGGRLAGRTSPGPPLWAGGFLTAGLVAAVGLFPLAGSVSAFLMVGALSGLLEPIYDTALNRMVPEKVRATVLSAPSSGFSLGMVVLFPLAGLIMARVGLPPAYLMASGFLSVVLIATLWLGRRRKATS